jgi:protoporphyrinogen oxidase
MDKKVLIVGSGGGGLMAAKIAELQAQNPDMEVVTIEEAKERGLSQTFEIKAQPLLDKRHYFKPPPTRAERRKQERMNKKKR